jgi:hypothetical protein
MPVPDYKLTRYFIIDSVIYWEHNLLRIHNKPGYFLFNNHEVTIQEIINLASGWEAGIIFGSSGSEFPKSEIQTTLYKMCKPSHPVYLLFGGGGLYGFTAEELQEFVDYIELESSQRDDYSSNKEKKEERTDLELYSREPEEKDGEGEEPIIDEREGDELLKRIADNLQAKLEAVKRYRKVRREVALMREGLARKEEELKECERVIELESGQV